jgi:predicted metal-binding membrane protein
MTAALIRGPSALLRIRQAARRNPEYGAVLAIVTAWVAVVGFHTDLAGGASAGHHHGLHAGPSVLATLPMWTVMCIAMMVPAALPAVRHVGTNSLRWRQQRAIVEFLAGYVGVWVAFGVVTLSALALVDGRIPSDGVLAAALGAAAVWQVLPYQRYFLRACHRTVPLPPRGWRAAAGCARFGFRHGRACLGVCGPLMVIMAVVIHHSVLWMAILTAASTALRLLPRSQRISTPIALALGTSALIFLAT